MREVVEIAISEVVIPQELLPRVITHTVEEKVQEYAQMMAEGVKFDPVLVWERSDGYWVIDGVHRVSACERIGKATIRAILVDCKDEIDYRIKSIQANLKHGMPLKREEKIILAKDLYKSGVSEEELRKLFGVSETTMWRWLQGVKKEEKEEKIKKVKELREQGWKMEDIAKELGVSVSTVHEYLKEDTDSFSENFKMKKSEKISSTIEEKEEEYTPTYSYADEEEVEEEDDQVEVEEDELEKYRQAYRRVFGDKEKETKAKKEERREERREENKLEEYYHQLRYVALQVLREFGRDKAVKVLERLLEEIRHET